MKYLVYMEVYYSLEVEADSVDEAHNIALNTQRADWEEAGTIINDPEDIEEVN